MDMSPSVKSNLEDGQYALSQTKSEAERAQSTDTKVYAVLAALMLVTLLISLDAMILATALPTITDEFHTIADVGWYVSAYMICNSALQPLTGKVFTYFDITLSYLAFCAVFAIGSAICGAAQSSSMLVIGRAVSGIGGSGLMNGAITMLSVVTPPHRRPMMMGLLMSVFGLGQIIGPLIGGSLTQHVSWRWCFYINLPISAVAAAALFLLRVRNPDQKRGLKLKTFIWQFDIIGFLLFAPACVMLLLPLQWGGSRYAWSSPTVIGLIVGAVGAFMVFVAWEYRQGEDAMFPGSLMKKTLVYSSCVMSLLLSGSLFIASYYLPLWFQAIRRTSPTMSAVYTLPLFGLQIVAVIVSGVLASTIGYFTPFALIGTMLSAIGTGLFCTFSPSSPASHYIGYQVLVGAGRGFAIQQPLNTVQACLTGAQMPTGMAIIAWSQFFGGAILVAVGQAAWVGFLETAVSHYTPRILPASVIAAGATNFETLAQTDPERRALLLAYNQSIIRVWYIAVACAVLATFAALGMGWKRVIKKPDASAVVKTAPTAAAAAAATTAVVAPAAAVVAVDGDDDDDDDKNRNEKIPNVTTTTTTSSPQSSR